MPYRVDLESPPDDAFDRLVGLGALDVDVVDGGIAAIIPDTVAIESVARALDQDLHALRVTKVRGRDAESTWVVQPHGIRVRQLEIVPADRPSRAGALRMIDGPAFGTGMHPTTELCLEGLDDELSSSHPLTVLDVGTGSGILALAALHGGVPRAMAIDIDADAVRVAAANARLNGMGARLALVHGGPDALSGAWPLVLANVLAAPLTDMAPTLSQRVAHNGRLILSGIRSSLVQDVERAYRRVGMRQVRTETRDGWSALTLHASW